MSQQKPSYTPSEMVRLDIPDPFEQARARLVFNQPFLRTILFGLEPFPTRSIPTAATDGKYLYVNPDWCAKQSRDEQDYAIAHEAMHVALAHQHRRENRHIVYLTPDGPILKWNICADIAINSGVLDKFGMKAPTTVCRDEAHAEHSAEEIYRLMPDPKNSCPIHGEDPSGDPQGGGGGKDDKDGDGGGDEKEKEGKDSDSNKDPKGGHSHSPKGKKCTCPEWLKKYGQGQCSGVMDGDPGDKARQGSLVRRALEAARQAGKVPGGLEELVGHALDPKVDWRSIMWQVAKSTIKSDYSYRRQNRRLLPRFILPTMISQEMTRVVVSLDTSGSVANEEISQFVAECQAILDILKPSEMWILQTDAELHDATMYRHGDVLPGEFKVFGRGGTSFLPPFEWVEKTLADPPDLFIYLTDLEGPFPDPPPTYPTLWVATTNHSAPFGQTVHMEVR